jgi:ribonuclease Z
VRGPTIGELSRQGEVTVGGRTIRIEEVSTSRPGQAFALVMDTRPCVGADQLARGTDLLVCESTYLNSEAQEAHEHFHMTATDAANLAQKSGARRLALTHFSQRYLTVEPFRVEASAIHPDVVVAEDLTRVPVPKRLG